MNHYGISDNDMIKILGRTSFTDGKLNLFWTASGIEMNTTATEMYLDMEVDFEKYEPWVEIYVDGVLSQKRMLDKGTSRVYVLRKMDPGKERDVKVIKCTQPHASDHRELCRILDVCCDGEMKPVHSSRLNIEVIGDSITSGEGLHGAYGEMSNACAMFAVDGSYHSLIARELDASVNLFSMCGYGVYCGWCGMVSESMPRYYEEVCGVIDNVYDKETGAHDKWDFSSFETDYVIINLGTNDSGSFGMSGQYVEDKDWHCPVKINADGSEKKEDLKDVHDAAMDFLRNIRKHNPSAVMIWCYGMIPGRLDGTLRDAVMDYRGETGDADAYYISLPVTKEDEFGSRFHPGRPSHQHAAEMITEFIRKLETA